MFRSGIGKSARALSWSPSGISEDDGCLLVVITNDGKVRPLPPSLTCEATMRFRPCGHCTCIHFRADIFTVQVICYGLPMGEHDSNWKIQCKVTDLLSTLLQSDTCNALVAAATQALQPGTHTLLLGSPFSLQVPLLALAHPSH